MAKVLVLPEHIASQIAAGEVIERPASVVKELVENSIDAGATQIEISVSADCRDIRVADNGCGMEPEDAVLAFQRHATSKLASAEDLWSLRTMGFRGEALPSIASIARLVCYTRTPEAQAGTKVEAFEGTVAATETGCAPGTVIEVTDLFYNVPARLKFLKKPSTEFAHIQETVQHLAISFPKIVFQLLHAGQPVLKTSGSGKLAQAMSEAGFTSGREELCPVTFAELKYGMAIYGYVARPTHFRGDKKGILTIVNNRPVRCPLTFKALDYAYSDLIPKGKSPIAVLTITVEPGLVDVNVHPTKREIKYSNSNDVYLALQRAVVEALRPGEVAAEEPSQAAPAPAPVAPGSRTYASEEVRSGETIVSEGKPAEPAASRAVSAVRTTEQMRLDRLSLPPARTGTSQIALPTSVRARVGALPAGWRLIGYLKETYFLVETPEGFSIIEQHIAHERVIYERLRAAQETPGRLSDSSQRLVISVPLDLSAAQRAAVEEHMEILRKLGFDFELQDQSVLCTQVPLELAHKDYASAVQKIVEDLCLTGSAEMELEATKSVACQAAVKNGMPLSDTDIAQLIAEWHKTPRNDTCPHGRPIKLDFPMEKLYQLFHP
ncbi:MAG TPA: DNA mismatch repair endonuclease MutL [Candidatus Obscuribacterales bacterium]